MQGVTHLVQAATLAARVKAAQSALGGPHHQAQGDPGGSSSAATDARATSHLFLTCLPERAMLLRLLMRGSSADAGHHAAALRSYAALSGDALAVVGADKTLRRITLLLGKKDQPAKRQAEGWTHLTRLPWDALSAGVEAARTRVDLLRLHREAHIAGESAAATTAQLHACRLLDGALQPRWHRAPAPPRAAPALGPRSVASLLHSPRWPQHHPVPRSGLAVEVALSEQDAVAAQVAAAAAGNVPGG